MHLVNPDRWVNFHVSTKRASYMIHIDGFVTRERPYYLIEFSMIMAKGGKPDQVLISFHECIVTNTPLLDATSITRWNMTDDYDCLAFLLGDLELFAKPFKL